jgi:hypothetical protein
MITYTLTPTLSLKGRGCVHSLLAGKERPFELNQAKGAINENLTAPFRLNISIEIVNLTYINS